MTAHARPWPSLVPRRAWESGRDRLTWSPEERDRYRAGEVFGVIVARAARRLPLQPGWWPELRTLTARIAGFGEVLWERGGG